jgi:predicted dienelactone hydrolase
MLFALNELELVNRGPTELRGRLDLERIGAAGHALGALTALNVAGQPLPTSAGPRSFADARVKAVLALSAPLPGQRDALPDAYRPLRAPVMLVTGARAEQRLPFDHISGVDQVLVAFRDGDPLTFVARKLAFGERRKEPTMQELLFRSSLLFWDAYLKGDGEARQALQRLDGAVKPLAAAEFKSGDH